MNHNNNRTASILQRLPVILAVTAASYGLQTAQAATTAVRPATSKSSLQAAAGAKATATRHNPTR